MALRLHRPWGPGRTRSLAALVWLLMASSLFAQAPEESPSAATQAVAPDSVEARLRRLERQHSAILDWNRRIEPQITGLEASEPDSEPGDPAADLLEHDGDPGPLLNRVIASPTGPLAGTDEEPDRPLQRPDNSPDPAAGFEVAPPGPAFESPWFAGFDDGFVIRPSDPDEFPFELKFNNQNQFPYTGFARDVRTWTDSVGVVSPVTDRSNFELPRGRAIFSGFAFLPQLTYNLNIDYNTVSDNQINFRSYWLGYRFNRSLSLFVGQNKVPGSRE
jgi:hypothetical protein